MDSKHLTIGLVSPYAMISGGVQNHILDLKKQLEQRGHTVYLFAPKLNNEKPPTSNTIFIGKAFLFYAEGTSFAVGLWPEEGKKIQSLFASIPFDVFHFHSPNISPISWQLGAYANKPIVVTFHEARETHTPWYNLFRIPVSFLGHKVQNNIADSKACKQTIATYFPRRFSIIPPGIDTTRFTPHGPTLPWFNKRIFTILFLGRLEERKGIINLVKSFKLIKAAIPSATLVIGGQGILEDEIRHLIMKNNLTDIRLIGFVPEEEKAAFYRSGHVFVAPATHDESFGIVLLEAMSSGCPIVAAGNHGYKELLKGEKEGVLTPVKNPERLSEAIISLGKNSSKRTRLSNAGVKRAKAYDWQVITPQIMGVYHDAIRKFDKKNKMKSDDIFQFKKLWKQMLSRLDKEVF